MSIPNAKDMYKLSNSSSRRINAEKIKAISLTIADGIKNEALMGKYIYTFYINDNKDIINEILEMFKGFGYEVHYNTNKYMVISWKSKDN